MEHGTLASEQTIRTYLTVLHEAMLNARMRIRYGETISADELHDLLDSLHNIPEMLCRHGDWFVEQNIDADLQRYDDRWCSEDPSTLRSSRVATLNKARADRVGRGTGA